MFSQPRTSSGLAYEVVQSRGTVDDWQAEAIDYEGDGVIHVACFSGPDAEARAREYANWKNGQRRRE